MSLSRSGVRVVTQYMTLVRFLLLRGHCRGAAHVVSPFFCEGFAGVTLLLGVAHVTCEVSRL